MAVTTPCVEKYTSVTLAAGEQFTLPPGATLISASNIDAITDDGCLDREQLEELACYTIRFAGHCLDGSGTEVWAQDNTDLIGINSNNTEYLFSSSAAYLTVSNSTMETMFNSLGIGIFSYFNAQAGGDCGDGIDVGDRGWTRTITFAGIPSVVENMQVILRTNAISMEPGSENGFAFAYLQPVLTSEFTVSIPPACLLPSS
jgi:hypothetical protein